ncbi:MAG: hypothetical protein LBU32_19940 [Clostridiales bacterium]|jgi:AcrR family transcriptional regulator|nr:hypothetical protein [Clostridiales bacterium]
MPPKANFNKRLVMESALELVREKGMEAISARAISTKLGCSTRPLYSLYEDMEKLIEDLLQYANQYFGRHLEDFSKREKLVENDFMKFGLAYIDFAKTETNLFKMLFLSNSFNASGFSDLVSPVDHAFILDSIPGSSSEAKNEKELQRHFLDVWIYTHGMAVMAAFGGVDFSHAEVIQMLTHASKSLSATSE